MTAPELWWVLSAVSVAFLIVDWSHAPIDTTMHVGFLLIAAAMGPLGAVTYVLTVREPLPGTHLQYIAPRWKQVIGSTFHCVAGDSVGIIGAGVAVRFVPAISASMILSLTVEYLTGFLVGWLIFQSLFMKDMAGGSYRQAVKHMFLPEWLSMNGVMAGMIAVMVPWMRIDPSAGTPSQPTFWFMMSMALIAGAIVAYPLNWWLVGANLKHGIMSTATTQDHSMSVSGPTDSETSQKKASHMSRHLAKSAPGSTKTRARTVVPIAFWSVGLLGTALALTLW